MTDTPVWIKGRSNENQLLINGFRCNNVSQEIFGASCALAGFDLPAFDRWLDGVPDGQFKTDVLEYRETTMQAALNNEHQLAKLGMNLLHFTKELNRQIDFLRPLAQRDTARQAGTRKERAPEINNWIRDQLNSAPDVTRDELWNRAPEWLTDRIGVDRFKKRVSKVRHE